MHPATRKRCAEASGWGVLPTFDALHSFHPHPIRFAA